MYMFQSTLQIWLFFCMLLLKSKWKLQKQVFRNLWLTLIGKCRVDNLFLGITVNTKSSSSQAAITVVYYIARISNQFCSFIEPQSNEPTSWTVYKVESVRLPLSPTSYENRSNISNDTQAATLPAVWLSACHNSVVSPGTVLSFLMASESTVPRYGPVSEFTLFICQFPWWHGPWQFTRSRSSRALITR